MRIAVVGGGPGRAVLRRPDQAAAIPAHEITVWERNAADDTFGFGVVFSDETLGGIEHADEQVFEQMQREFARWDDIDVHFRDRGADQRRPRLRRDEPTAAAADPASSAAANSASTLHFSTPAPDVAELAATHDLVVACDGVNSAVRSRYAATFGPTLDVRRCKYMWLGTNKVFDAFKFYVRETPCGVMQIHGYPYDAKGSTFIVEMNRRSGNGPASTSSPITRSRRASPTRSPLT